MLPYSAQARLTAAASLFVFLASVHYFLFPSLDRIHFNIVHETVDLDLTNGGAGANNTSNITADAAAALIKQEPEKERWPIKWIPEKHWQSWKLSVADLEPLDLECMRSWRQLNPFHRYEAFTDDSAENFVRDAYSESRPDIVETYFAIKDKIARADILRYLILYARGGVYSDIDTKALKPINTWIPEQMKNKVNAVIGLEIDDPGSMWGDWADNFAMCQSTLMASPGHKIYEMLIANIQKKFNDISQEQHTDLANVQLSFQDILRVTGPVAFTDAVLAYLTVTMGEPITRANFSGINMPKNMADVLVMPVVSFVPGQPHSRAGKVTDREALVQHVGKGSWRATHKYDAEIKDEKEKAAQAALDQAAEEEKKKKEQEEKLKNDAENPPAPAEGEGAPKEEGKAEEGKKDEEKAEDGKDAEKPAEEKPDNKEPEELKMDEQKPGEQKPGEQKPGEQKPGEQKPGEQKPGEQKPADAKPGDKKPEDAKPADQKPGDAKPADEKPGDAKPEDAKPADQKPGDAPTEENNADKKPGEQKPGEQKPEEPKEQEKKPDAKIDDKKPDEKKPDAEKPDERKPDAELEDQKADEKKPDAAKPDDKKPEEKKEEEKKPAGIKPGDNNNKPPAVDDEDLAEAPAAPPAQAP